MALDPMQERWVEGLAAVLRRTKWWLERIAVGGVLIAWLFGWLDIPWWAAGFLALAALLVTRIGIGGMGGYLIGKHLPRVEPRGKPQ